jgi:hypothetical protein
MVDASFRYANWHTKVDLGLEQVNGDPAADAAGLTDAMLSIANRWDHLGSRVALLILLYVTAIAATGLMAITCVRTRSIVVSPCF